jgi:hypothetical protein
MQSAVGRGRVNDEGADLAAPGPVLLRIRLHRFGRPVYPAGSDVGWPLCNRSRW